MKYDFDIRPIPIIGNSRFYSEFNVGNMLPQTSLEQNNNSDDDKDINNGGNDDMNIVDTLFEDFFNESSDNAAPGEIKNIVNVLENKGYQVKYASPGHDNTRFDNDRNSDGVINAKMVTTGRIIFSRDYKFNKTPQGWKWKVLSNGSKALYVKEYTYNEKMGTKEEAFKKWQVYYLESLRDWADSLPKCGESDKVKNISPDINFN